MKGLLSNSQVLPRRT